MCRNITTLRGLVPDATGEEIEAAARQYVRKVSGVASRSIRTEPAVEQAVAAVAAATTALLRSLPPRRIMDGSRSHRLRNSRHRRRRTRKVRPQISRSMAKQRRIAGRCASRSNTSGT